MDLLQGELRQVWAFVLGHSMPKDFEQWLFSDPSIKDLFGETFYMDLASADYRDPRVIADLKGHLMRWALNLSPPEWQWLWHRYLPVINLRNGLHRRLLPIGYWQSDEEPELPHPREHVDLCWDEAERLRVIEYLEGSYIMGGYLGYSWCRMGCPDARMTGRWATRL